jgi:hypothetical protein
MPTLSTNLPAKGFSGQGSLELYGLVAGTKHLSSPCLPEKTVDVDACNK